MQVWRRVSKKTVAYPVVDVGLEKGVQEDCDERDEEENLNHLDPSGPWQLVADTNEPVERN
jgi:hypothetical protein